MNIGGILGFGGSSMMNEFVGDEERREELEIDEGVGEIGREVMPLVE